VTGLLALLLVTAAAGAAPVPSPDHVVVIVFENKEQQQVIGSPSAPTFTALARKYVRFTNYRALTHPSLPNYIAMVSGGTQGIRSNCTSCIADAPNLADTVEESGRTWKAYAEGLPRPGFTGSVAGRYAKKHMPFLYFRDVVSSPTRRRRVVPLTQLRTDLQAGTLPNFALIVPDMCNSMHDCSVRTGDRWLARTVPPLLKLPNTVVFVTFDEGLRRNNVPALALGTAVRPSTRVATPAGHYALLRTIEEAWGLRLLGRSASAKPFTTMWRDSVSRME
jgi:phosphatidylinositol-3-phosphatase